MPAIDHNHVPRGPAIACNIAHCGERSTYHITEARSRQGWRHFDFCAPHAEEYLRGSGSPDRGARLPGPTRHGCACFDIDLVVISDRSDEQLLYLQKTDGGLRFPVTIGTVEATAVEWLIKGLRTRRPLTHAAMARTIELMGGTLRDVVIDSWNDHVFTAKLHITQMATEVAVDVRPSDALALALVCHAPIYVADSVVRGLAARDTR